MVFVVFQSATLWFMAIVGAILFLSLLVLCVHWYKQVIRDIERSREPYNVKEGLSRFYELAGLEQPKPDPPLPKSPEEKKFTGKLVDEETQHFVWPDITKSQKS